MNMKKMKRTIVILSCILLLLVIVAVIVSLPLEKDYGEYRLLNTPIGELYFTERWEKHTVTEDVVVNEGYAVNIYAETTSGKVRLNTLYIGADTQNGFPIGYVDELEVRVDVPAVELDNTWTKKNIDIVYTMQEDLNCIIDQIVDMDGFRAEGVADALPEETFGEYVLLSTPIGELYFSERWKNYTTVDEIAVDNGYSVSISAETASGTTEVYELYIGTETGAGSVIGYIDDAEIRVNVPEINPGSAWSDEDIDTVYTMQEALNCLVDQIVEIDGFSRENAGSQKDASFDEYVLISTPIGDLYFTEQWKDYIVTHENATDDGYVVTISVVTDSGTVKLNDLYIGAETDAGLLLGSVNDVSVRIDIADVVLGSDWNAEDTDIVYTIQEALECVADQIAEMDGFASA